MQRSGLYFLKFVVLFQEFFPGVLFGESDHHHGHFTAVGVRADGDGAFFDAHVCALQLALVAVLLGDGEAVGVNQFVAEFFDVVVHRNAHKADGS